jgi:RIO-like serine/threonine protein kinase
VRDVAVHEDLTPGSFDVDALLPAIEAALSGAHLPHKSGNQGAVHVIVHGARRYAVKAATGPWPLRSLRERHLRHEHRAYQRLRGVRGVPHCYGLAGGRYLVLDYVSGPNARDAQLVDRDAFYDRALRTILEMHSRGVAHADLKRRDNILVTAGEEPLIVDYGIAVLRRPGSHPLNHLLFDLARRLDLNAWIKHKYRHRRDEISDADRVHYRPMLFEALWRAVRRVVRAPWRALRRLRVRS